MPDFFRPRKFPYAISSTGQYRGLLIRKYPCWDAQGPARSVFIDEIAAKIKACLEQCLLESNSFVGFSLFMVGKLPEKTKPTIMIVSDDKPRRKTAFQIVKSKNILADYPGFELGHCSVAAEFEDLKQLGSGTASSWSDPESSHHHQGDHGPDEESEPDAELVSLLSAEICAFEYPRQAEPTRLYFHTSSNTHSHKSAFATCGGLFGFHGEIYALTMAHAIRSAPPATTTAEPQSDSSSQSDDFEITGMDEWDDEEDEEEENKTLTAITSPGSKTPTEYSDSGESPPKNCASQLVPELLTQFNRSPEPPTAYEEDYIMNDDGYKTEDEDQAEDDTHQICERFGSVVGVDQVLDIAVIKTVWNIFTAGSPSVFLDELMDLDDFIYPDSPTVSGTVDTSITIETTHHPRIRGHRSLTPFYTRLPHTAKFLELYSAQLSTPVRRGDSGSWAFNKMGELIGLVVAGSLKTASCLLLPAKPALVSFRSLLINRLPLVDISNFSRPDSSISPWVLLASPWDEDATTTASSRPQSSMFSHRTGRGPSSTATHSTATTSYEHELKARHLRRTLLQGNERRSVYYSGQEGHYAPNYIDEHQLLLRLEEQEEDERPKRDSNGNVHVGLDALVDLVDWRRLMAPDDDSQPIQSPAAREHIDTPEEVKKGDDAPRS